MTVDKIRGVKRIYYNKGFLNFNIKQLWSTVQRLADTAKM